MNTMRTDDLERPLLSSWRRPAPLLVVAVGLIVGITLDNAFELDPRIPLITATLILPFGFVARRKVDANLRWLLCTFVLAVAVGCVRYATSLRFHEPNHFVHFVDDEPIIVTVRGRVSTPPRIVEAQPDRPRPYSTSPKTRFVLKVDGLLSNVGMIQSTGLLDVSIKEPMPLLSVGNVVQITGRLTAPRPPSNPGAFDWKLYLQRIGIFASMSTDHAAAVVTVEHRDSMHQWLSDLRIRANGYLLGNSVRNDESAGVISAMVLGQRSAVDTTINEAFVRTGTAHFLAASGMHVGWLALMAWWFTRFLGIHYRACAILVAFTILAYILLAEPRPAILRAGILGILACFSIFPRGKINVVNWLAASAIVILMITPAALFQPAFQFSFVAVISIILLTSKFSAALSRSFAPFRSLDERNTVRDAAVHLPLEPSLPSRNRILMDTILQAFRLMLAASLAAWIGNIPLACYHFNQFSPLGAIFTILLWPAAFVVTGLGFAKLTLGLPLPSFAMLIDPLLHSANNFFVATVEFSAKTPFAVIKGNSPSLLWVIGVYIALAVYGVRPHTLSRRRWAIIALLLTLWWMVPARWIRADRGALNVWMLAVGDGTGTVIELPDGRAMLFDFGTRTPFDVVRVAESFLAYRGIDRIDSAFVSHANFDHYGAIEYIHRETPIGRVELSDQFEAFVNEKDGAWYFLKALNDAEVEIRTHHGPTQWTDPSGVEFELLWPPPLADRPAPDANNSSLALRLIYQGKSVLLTGDQAEWGLGGLIASGNVRADVLALPHHGSVVHNTAAFIEAVDPSVAVRSTGQSSSMTNNGIESLVGNTRRYFSTADNGCVRIRIKDGKIETTFTID